MDLNILWFILVSVLFIGFYFLEGFDYGVGILLPFLGRDDLERRLIINSIGPFWDGNEVWMLTAGGALFAAFPNWYATLFSGFYLALFLILAALIVRGIAFEFRSKDESLTWRSLWDWMIFFGSLLPALLWGVAMANLIKGVPIDSRMEYVGTFFDLLSPYTLVGGLAVLFLFMLHGNLFLSLKLEGALLERSNKLAVKLAVITIPVFLLFVLLSYLQTDLFKNAAGIVQITAVITLTLAYTFFRAGKNGRSFIFTGLTIALYTISIFWGLFPRVMVSSLNPEWSLNIYNASSSPYTLKIMTIIALTLVPVILLYQAWTYWVFRQRVNVKNLEY
ncbi:MAG: cytochrome d ubiquinol oxidase subunit II [Bacillota bacterium]